MAKNSTNLITGPKRIENRQSCKEDNKEEDNKVCIYGIPLFPRRSKRPNYKTIKMHFQKDRY